MFIFHVIRLTTRSESYQFNNSGLNFYMYDELQII